MTNKQKPRAEQPEVCYHCFSLLFIYLLALCVLKSLQGLKPRATIQSLLVCMEQRMCDQTLCCTCHAAKFSRGMACWENAETVRDGPSVDLLRTSFPKISLPHCLMHRYHAVKAFSLVILLQSKSDMHRRASEKTCQIKK